MQAKDRQIGVRRGVETVGWCTLTPEHMPSALTCSPLITDACVDILACSVMGQNSNSNVQLGYLNTPPSIAAISPVHFPESSANAITVTFSGVLQMGSLLFACWPAEGRRGIHLRQPLCLDSCQCCANHMPHASSCCAPLPPLLLWPGSNFATVPLASYGANPPMTATFGGTPCTITAVISSTQFNCSLSAFT